MTETFVLRALLKLVLRRSLPLMDERNVLWVNFPTGQYPGVPAQLAAVVAYRGQTDLERDKQKVAKKAISKQAE